MQPEATLIFKVMITKPPQIGATGLYEETREPDELLGFLSFYCVPRKGELIAHADGEENLRGYMVERVYHYTGAISPDDESIGMIQVVFQTEDKRE